MPRNHSKTSNASNNNSHSNSSSRNNSSGNSRPKDKNCLLYGWNATHTTDRCKDFNRGQDGNSTNNNNNSSRKDRKKIERAPNFDSHMSDPGAFQFDTNNNPGFNARNNDTSGGRPGYTGFVKDTTPRWQAARGEESLVAEKPYCCFCNSTSHEKRECRDDQGKIRFHASTLVCQICETRGHMKSECQNPIAKRCTSCWLPGHLSKECKQNPNGSICQFLNAISGPSNGYKWRNTDNIMPNRIQALYMWLEHERNSAYQQSRFPNPPEIAAIEQALGQLQQREFHKMSQPGSTPDAAQRFLQSDLNDLRQEVQRVTGIHSLTLNYAIAGVSPNGSFNGFFNGLSTVHTSRQPRLVYRFGMPIESSQGEFTYAEPFCRRIINTAPVYGTNQLTAEGISDQEWLQLPLAQQLEDVFLRKINKSKAYARMMINNKLHNIEKRILENGLLSRQRMDQVKHAMRQYWAFYRDPEAFKALVKRERPHCLKCGEQGYILDKHFNEIKAITPIWELLNIEDFEDWGIVVAFECGCAFKNLNGPAQINYHFQLLPAEVREQIDDSLRKEDLDDLGVVITSMVA